MLTSCSNQLNNDINLRNEIEDEESIAGYRPGTFNVSMDDWKLGTVTLNENGRYQNYYPNGELASEGYWDTSGNMTCFTPIQDDEIPMCWVLTETRSDASFTATSDDGDTVLLEPVVDH